MRYRILAIAAIAVVAYFAINKYKPTASDLPPAPAAIINSTRDRLTPFRFTMTTDPAAPNYNSSILLKVHVIDGANQPADGVALTADVSMSGMDHGAQHLTLEGKGGGDYEGRLNLEMAGSWDVDLTAAKDDKNRKQRLSIEVGG
jgi:hypothetical protein